MKRANLLGLAAVIALGLSNCGGGGSNPAGPGQDLPVAAGFRITGVTPANPVIGAEVQSITVTGVNFGTGMSLTVQNPGPPTPPFTFPNLNSLTATSFVVFYKFPVVGTYTFQLKSSSGESSNVVSFTPQFRTSGSTWIPEGIRLTETAAGFPGSSLADPAVIRMNDGRWRILIGAAGDLRSAISTDGLSMTMEPGLRLGRTTPSGQAVRLGLVRVLRLDDGRLRLYGGSPNPPSGIYSAISTDEGFTWTIEDGARILASPSPTGLSVVRMSDGRWRGYYSTGSCTGGTQCNQIYSATSSDLLNWTPDPGVRIGSGATGLTADGAHPKAILNSDGSTTLFYWGTRITFVASLITSTSSNGLSFTSETTLDSLGSAADPDVVQVGSGLRMYYNWGDDNRGTLFSALSASGRPSAVR